MIFGWLWPLCDVNSYASNKLCAGKCARNDRYKKAKFIHRKRYRELAETKWYIKGYKIDGLI